MDDNESRELGEVWKDRTYKAKRPWFVKTTSGVARYSRKKDAVGVGELFKKERDRQVELQRTIT